MILVAVVASTVTSSCSSADEPLPEPTPNEEGTTYEVSLNLAGDYTDVTEEPLGRAGEEAPKKYYGVNVYCMKTDGSESKYSFYAYGIFDNVEDMKISLLGGYKYKFECASYENAEDSVYISYSNYFGQYPFNSRKLENKFNITTWDSYKLGINSTKTTTVATYNRYKNYKDYNGNTYSASESYNNTPQLKVMYGSISDFEPAKNKTATIPLIKVGYGLKIVVNGVPDGSLEVSPPSLGNSSCSSSNYGTTSSSNYWSKTFTEAGEMEKSVADGIFSASSYSDWENRIMSYTSKNTIYFYWTRANGYRQEFTEEVTLKRNVKTVVTVNLTGGASDISIGINEDNAEMSDENVNVDYDGGDMNDTPVNPEE